MQTILKILLSALILTAVSELAKRNSFWAALLASLPLTSLLAFIWVYLDSGDVEKISNLSASVFWLVLPSLALFIALPLLLRHGVNFWLSLGLSSAFTALMYAGMLKILRWFGIQL